jgi:hypothetical protein
MSQSFEESDQPMQNHVPHPDNKPAQYETREPHDLKETVGAIGGCLTYLAFASLPVILIVAFLKSIEWIGETLLPILATGSVIGFLLVVPFLLLSIFRAIRPWAGLGLTLSSYAIGLHLWVWSLLIAYALAGIFWIVVGLIFAGIGVVAVAAVASALNHEWFVLIQIVVTVVIVYALRVLGAYLIDK